MLPIALDESRDRLIKCGKCEFPKAGDPLQGTHTMNTPSKIRALGVAGLLFPLLAAAAPSVAVIASDKCDQPAILQHAKSYRQALEARLGGELLSEADSIARLGGTPKQFLSLGEVERLLTGATTDVFEGQTSRALKTLTGVPADLERLPPSPARYAALINVLSLIGHVQLKQAKTDPSAEAAAAATFDRILRSDHEWSPNADLYPPATRNFVAKLRAKAQKKSTRVALTVSTKPAGLPVFVDAKPLGTSPQTILLPAGGTYSVEADWGEGKRGLTRMVALEEAPAVIELDRAFEGSVFPDKLCMRTDGSRKGRLAIAARLTALLGVQTVHAIREEEPAAQERFVTAVTLSASGEERVEGRIKLYAGTLTPAAWDSFVAFMVTGERPLPPVEAIQGPGVSSTFEPVAAAAPTEAITAPAPADSPHAGSGLRAAGIVVGALGVGAAGTAIFFGAQTGAATRRLAAACPGGICTATSSSSIEEAERAGSLNSTLTLATGAVAGALVVTSVILFVVSSHASSSAQLGGLTFEPSASGVTVRF